MSGLRLLAQDEEDLRIVSAHLQDAILRISDLAYLPRQHRFVMMLNRFCWEGCPEGSLGERVLTGLHFDGVLKVQSQNVRQDDPEAVAVLLAIDFAPSGDGGGVVDFILSGGGRIRLEVECIEASLRDIADPRPAVARPAHQLETG